MPSDVLAVLLALLVGLSSDAVDSFFFGETPKKCSISSSASLSETACPSAPHTVDPIFDGWIDFQRTGLCVE